ncbi:MAG TPA: hypothetical protein VFM35_05985, partial [Candidatus Binatia bacterium]|nr:hypothetical protein [Candidatus Binatia bacterium]
MVLPPGIWYHTGHLTKGEAAVRTRIPFVFLLSVIIFSAPLAWAQKGTIKVAVQAPLSGEQAALGEHVKLGA